MSFKPIADYEDKINNDNLCQYGGYTYSWPVDFTNYCANKII